MSAQSGKRVACLTKDILQKIRIHFEATDLMISIQR